MTIAGFLITALIVFAAFAVWYYVVQRNKPGAGENRTRMANFMTEIGDIEDASPRKRQPQQGNNGYTASSFEYMGENRAVSDNDSQQPVKTAQSSAQVFQTEVGTMGETGQAQGQSAQAQSRVNGVKTAKQSAQVFQSEIGTIGGAGQGQAQGAQSQAFQSGAVKTAESSAQIFQSEIGSIGAAGQGQQEQGYAGYFGQDQQASRSKQSPIQRFQQGGQQFNTEVGTVGFNEPAAHRAARMELVQGGHQAAKQQNHQKYTVEAGEIGELGQRLDASVEPQFQPPGATLPSPDSTQLNQQAQQDQQG
ncbi:hypothetical protein OS242_13855 [Tumebacillus sp. DT12]|uniref:Uncharacterized protein n=1 Tax=Tumebacillus lacus TaxID=2995335 RepID=A0ABT3X622_9BACL|nr:hypothetical protein [Tumebacillus lacus]MCX7571030.1 hypothetical protein [Tumebacillus lacus]